MDPSTPPPGAQRRGREGRRKEGPGGLALLTKLVSDFDLI